MTTHSLTATVKGEIRSVPGRTRETATLRRAKILDAAIGLIGERGYYGFTIYELGKRCGLSNPGLLHYFPSKQHVLLGVLEEIEAREATFMGPLVHAQEGDRSPRMVLHIFTTMVERAIANPQLARVIVCLRAEALDPLHPAHCWWREREAKTLAFLSIVLRPVVADPDIAAGLVLACMDGLFLQWLGSRHEAKVVPDWEQALRRLLPELFIIPTQALPA